MSGGASIDRRGVLVTGAAAALLAPAPLRAAARSVGQPVPIGRGQDFDGGWRFHRGVAEGAEAPAFNDSEWRAVDLPHDWRIEDLAAVAGDPDRIRGPFDRDAMDGTYPGFSVGGEGWYRKRFTLSTPRPGRCEIAFEGVYINSDVWVNGRHLGNHKNGYTPFAYDITPYLSDSGDNTVAVRVRDVDIFARWYPGSGITRHVRLDVFPESARIGRWDTAVATRRIDDGVADLDVSIGLEGATEGLTLASRIVDAKGRPVWEKDSPAGAAIRLSARIADARLWSPETPVLYTLVSELRRGRAVIDRTETPFGVRIITIDARQGFAINGTPTKLRGGCIHHDHGILGAAAFDLAEDRKVQLLKARGFNAVRPSHNLFSPAFLHACDRHGMMVICETFDAWLMPKFPKDFSTFFRETWRNDLGAIVRSARNHPSIVMWSIGNEIPGRYEVEGVQIQWELANEVRRLDPTRAVTAGLNGFAGHEATASAAAGRKGLGERRGRVGWLYMDVAGYNYKLADYQRDHLKFPEQVFMGTESFAKDVFRIWDMTDRNPWLIGDFVWVAMDYLGEASMGFGKWPWVNAYSGDLDLIGNRKPPSLARDVAWGLSSLEVAVARPDKHPTADVIGAWGWPDELESWTWPGHDGKIMTVRIYTRGDRVALLLNGKSVADRSVTAADGHRVELQAPYVPGTLEVVGYLAGREIGRRRLETAGAPAAIRLRPERFGGGAGRGDISFVQVDVVDAQGRVVPDAEIELEVAVQGTGELVAFGSGNPLATGSYQSGKARAWRGRALAIVRGSGKSGRAVVRASGTGLPGVSRSLSLK